MQGSASQLRALKRSPQQQEDIPVTDLMGKTSTFISNTSASTETGESFLDSNDISLVVTDIDSSNNDNGVTGSDCRGKGGCKSKKNENVKGSRTRGGENI